MSTINVLGPVGLNPTGAYDATKQYERLDVVEYQGSSYVAKDDSIGQVPSDNSEYWDIIAAGGLGQDDIIDNLTSTATDKLLSANQGRVLKGLVDDNTDDIETLQSQVSSLASGSPLVASSISEMTDTTRVYVNTTDGKWYYYDGDSWEIGGTYQAAEDSDTVDELVSQVNGIEKTIDSTLNDINKISKKPTYILIDSWHSTSATFTGFGTCVKANCILNKVKAIYKCDSSGHAICEILDTSINSIAKKEVSVNSGENNIIFDFGYLNLLNYTNVWIRFYSNDGATPIRADVKPVANRPNVANITNPCCYYNTQSNSWVANNDSSYQVPFEYYIVDNSTINTDINHLNDITDLLINEAYNITIKPTYDSIYLWENNPSYNFTGFGACIVAGCIINKISAKYKCNSSGHAICEIADTSSNVLAIKSVPVVANEINDIVFDFGYLDLKEYANVWIRFYSNDGATPIRANLLPSTNAPNIANISNPYCYYQNNAWGNMDNPGMQVPFSFYTIDNNNVGKVYYCGTNRPYKTLKSAIEEATKYMDSIIYVDAGTYDLITEFGSEYFANLTSTTNLEGLMLKNRVHIIFSANSKVVCNYTGNNTVVNKSFSPFNAGEYGFTLENLTLECSNVRYCVHDERNGATEQCISRYINCNMYIDNHANTEWLARQCIGGGLGSNHTVDIKNCIFLTDYQGQDAVYYHQSGNQLNPNHRATINIYNCYFKSGTITLSFGRTDASENSIVEITNCSMKKYSSADTDGIIKLGSGNHREFYFWNNDIRN